MKGKNESPKGETATFFFFVLAARGAWVPNDGRFVFPIKSFLLWWPRWPIFFLALIICSNCCPSDSNRPELSVCALCRYLHVISSYRRDHRSWRPTCLPATTFSIIETSLYIRPSFLSSQPYSADSTGLWITSDERLTWINLRRHFISKWAPHFAQLASNRFIIGPWNALSDAKEFVETIVLWSLSKVTKIK